MASGKIESGEYSQLPAQPLGNNGNDEPAGKFSNIDTNKNIGYKSDKYHLEADRAQHKHDLDALTARLDHDCKACEKSMGRLGRFFGKDTNSSKNIAFTILTILLVLGLAFAILQIFIYFNPSGFVEKYWEQLFPIITLTMGYIFGKNNGKTQEN